MAAYALTGNRVRTIFVCSAVELCVDAFISGMMGHQLSVMPLVGLGTSLLNKIFHLNAFVLSIETNIQKRHTQLQQLSVQYYPVKAREAVIEILLVINQVERLLHSEDEPFQDNGALPFSLSGDLIRCVVSRCFSIKVNTGPVRSGSYDDDKYTITGVDVGS